MVGEAWNLLIVSVRKSSKYGIGLLSILPETLSTLLLVTKSPVLKFAQSVQSPIKR
jgi:hypothetical protein